MTSSTSKLSNFLNRWRFALAALVLLVLAVGVKFYLFINQNQMNNENDKSPPKEEKKVFTYQDLIKFSNT